MIFFETMRKELDNQRTILRFHDALSKLAEIERRLEIPSNKVELIPFEFWAPRSEDNLVLRIKGSPEDLADRALAILLLLKADMDTERFEGIDVSTRRALQKSLCEYVDVPISVKKHIRSIAERSAPDKEQFSLMAQMIENGMKELGPFEVVQVFEQARLEKNPLPHLMEALEEIVPLPRIGPPMDEEHRRILKRRPEEVMSSSEWNKVLESKGDVDPAEVTSVFSLLMAFVLKEPGLTIEEYTRRRNEVTRVHRHIGIKREVGPWTTSVEFSIIKKSGWVDVKDRRVYPRRIRESR